MHGDLSSCMPDGWRLLSPVVTLAEKSSRAADHQDELAFALGSIESCLMPLLQLGHALLQAGDALFELR